MSVFLNPTMYGRHVKPAVGTASYGFDMMELSHVEAHCFGGPDIYVNVWPGLWRMQWPHACESIHGFC